MSRILQVIPKENWCLEVQLESGAKILLSLKSRLETIRFGALSDLDLFMRASTDGFCIRWDRKAEIALDELYQFARAQGTEPYDFTPTEKQSQ